jgi:hypothetical protein
VAWNTASAQVTMMAETMERAMPIRQRRFLPGA